MEQLFASLAISGASLVGKAAFSYATKYAAKQISDLIQQQSHQNANPKYEDLLKTTRTLHQKLLHEIAVINPAMDLCETIASRGDTYLSEVSQLGEEFKREVESLGNSAESLMDESLKLDLSSLSPGDFNVQVDKIIEINKRIEFISTMAAKLVPFLTLSLQTSGINHNVYLSNKTSPTQLLKASYAITEASNKFDLQKSFIQTSTPVPVTVGKPFVVKLYSLFTSHSRTKGYDDSTWKELIPKCLVSIERTPIPRSLGKSYIYLLNVTQDLDDHLYHDEDNPEDPLRLLTPVDNIMQIYYSTSGSILKINNSGAPIIVIKLSKSVVEIKPNGDTLEDLLTKLSMKSSETPSWYAMELYDTNYTDLPETEDETDSSSSQSTCKLSTAEKHSKNHPSGGTSISHLPYQNPNGLSFLEYVIRLTSLEMKIQNSHLSSKDEQLCLCLSNTTRESPNNR